MRTLASLLAIASVRLMGAGDGRVARGKQWTGCRDELQFVRGSSQQSDTDMDLRIA